MSRAAQDEFKAVTQNALKQATPCTSIPFAPLAPLRELQALFPFRQIFLPTPHHTPVSPTPHTPSYLRLCHPEILFASLASLREIQAAWREDKRRYVHFGFVFFLTNVKICSRIPMKRHRKAW